MKRQHLFIRIDQCVALGTASSCSRSHHGALLLDPVQNTVLMDGFNGPPHGSHGPFCEGRWCAREGLTAEDLVVVEKKSNTTACGDTPSDMGWYIVHKIGIQTFLVDGSVVLAGPFDSYSQASAGIKEVTLKYPRLGHGHAEIGCDCAERKVLTQAMRRGISTEGAWMIVTGVPCLMCARLIHQAGIAKVVALADGYDNNEGVQYLHKYGVELEQLTMNDVRQIGRQIREEQRSAG